MGVTLCTAVKREYTRFDIILLNIHKTTSALALHGCCTSTSTADFCLLGKAPKPTVLQLFLRYSVVIYQCANASELICWCKTWQESMWVA